MNELRKYVRRTKTPVTAVQLDRDTDGFTIERETFEQTYQLVSPGVYIKEKPVWARMADEAGGIGTKEGATSYQAGDMIVFNKEDEQDGYAMTNETFEKLYKRADR